MFDRHDLLHVDPATWRTVLGRHPAIAGLPLIADWARRGWPVIVRRFGADEAEESIPAAIPLPPAHGKRRVALSFPSEVPLAPRPAVPLREASAVAPSTWETTIAALSAIGEDIGCGPHVYGALLWQHLTGLAYLSDRSDLDLLWAPRDAPSARDLVGRLAALEEHSPVRLDGEIRCSDGAGVNWRELAETPPDGRVLAKTPRGVELRRVRDLFQAGAP